MAVPTKLDHCVIHVSDWERSNAFYRDVMGAELVQRPVGWAYRFGAKQLNVHGKGVSPAEVARLPVQPDNTGRRCRPMRTLPTPKAAARRCPAVSEFVSRS